jgi:hypothetical protein
MKKAVGYVISGIGLILMFLNIAAPDKIPFLSSLGQFLGIGLVIIGVIIIMLDKNSKKIAHETAEVPIYEGKGKDRKIVGYQREKKK